MKHISGESGCGSRTCVIDLYVVNEMEDGVNILLRLFSDECITSLENVNTEVF